VAELQGKELQEGKALQGELFKYEEKLGEEEIRTTKLSERKRKRR
jgi:hypothetical protein